MARWFAWFSVGMGRGASVERAEHIRVGHLHIIIRNVGRAIDGGPANMDGRLGPQLAATGGQTCRVRAFGESA